MSNNKSVLSISTFTLLGILFVTLKLTGHIDWNWFWVILPFWIKYAFYGLMIMGFVAMAFCVLLYEKIRGY